MGLLTPWHLGYDFSGYTCASAVTIAMEKVHADPHLNANGRIRLRYVETSYSHATTACQNSVASRFVCMLIIFGL